MDNNSEEMMAMFEGGSMGVISRPGGMVHELRLDRPIEAPKDYADWVRTIRSAGENDLIELHLCTPGGRVDTTLYLAAALRDSPAHKHVIISGMCASGGTILMMCGDSWEIDPYTQFLFHNYSGGAMGKGHDIKLQTDYMMGMMEDVYKDFFDGFFDEEELTKVAHGLEHWMRAEEVGERLQDVTKCREEKMADAMEEVAKILEDAIVDLKKLTKGELLEMARKEGHEVTGKMTKKKLIELLED